MRLEFDLPVVRTIRGREYRINEHAVAIEIEPLPYGDYEIADCYIEGVALGGAKLQWIEINRLDTLWHDIAGHARRYMSERIDELLAQWRADAPARRADQLYDDRRAP